MLIFFSLLNISATAIDTLILTPDRSFLDPVQTRLAGRNCGVQLRGASADVESIPDGAR